MVADVQDWLINPVDNFGWIHICEQEDLEKSVRKFGSREASSTNRPSLQVQFTLPSPSVVLTLLPLTNSVFQFQFNAESNKNYTVLYGADLETTNWMTLTNITPLAAPANVLISDPLLTDGSNRFYRVRTP